jgi:opacity protein-like surface antigen
MKKAITVLVFSVFCIVPMQNAWAKSDIRFTHLGVQGGLVDPEGASNTLGIGAVAELGTIAPRYHLASYLTYWNKSETAYSAEASIRDISFSTRVKYEFPMASGKVQPYLGAGLGLHFLRSSVTIPDMDLGGGLILPGYTISDTATKLGVDLGGGLHTPVSATTNFFTDVWYTMSDVDELALYAGFTFQLAK